MLSKSLRTESSYLGLDIQEKSKIEREVSFGSILQEALKTSDENELIPISRLP